jgi:hypothetical protein
MDSFVAYDLSERPSMMWFALLDCHFNIPRAILFRGHKGHPPFFDQFMLPRHLCNGHLAGLDGSWLHLGAFQPS